MAIALREGAVDYDKFAWVSNVPLFAGCFWNFTRIVVIDITNLHP